MKIYIETSVISADAFGPEATSRLTRSFFRDAIQQGHELLTSGITIGEITASSVKVREKLLEVVSKNRIRVWRVDQRVWALAGLYQSRRQKAHDFNRGMNAERGALIC